MAGSAILSDEIPVNAGSYFIAHEQPCQTPPGANIIRHAEGGPPFGHTSICHDAGVEEIEYAVANERGDGYPEIALEPCDGSYHEDGHHARFDDQSLGCPPITANRS